MANLIQTYLVHQGSIFGELKVFDENRWYVTNIAYPETGNGQYINSTRSFATEKDAREYAAKKREAKGGSRRATNQAAAAAAASHTAARNTCATARA